MFFDIMQNNKTGDDSSPDFFKIKLTKGLIDKYREAVKISNNIYVNGYLNNYIKNGKTIFYIYPKNIVKLDAEEDINMNVANSLNDIISYDKDGVMLWHGKRCELTLPTKEEQKEMKDLLSEFK